MATKRQIAENLSKEYGALVSITDIQKHFGISKNKARGLTIDLKPFGMGTGKRYYYEDVAESLMRS